MQEYTFDIQESGVRLDAYLVGQFSSIESGFSRSFIQKLIREGNVLVDGKTVKPHHKIKSGEEIKIVIPPQAVVTPKPEDIPLEIVFEDEDVLVINKPRGLVAHPASGNLSATLVNALLFHCKDLSTVNPDRPGIVHRLDKDTAGLMVAAKNNKAHLSLAKQFSEHSIKRIYVALVLGKVEFDEGVVDLPIGRHPLNREKMAVDFKKDAKVAYTRYKVIKRYKDFTPLEITPGVNTSDSMGKKDSLLSKKHNIDRRSPKGDLSLTGFTFVELTPQTGRTHQLRVHMTALGHSILGDEVYGRKDKSIKLALYAKTLGFKHPKTGKFMEFEHDLPKDMRDILDKADEPRPS